MSDDYTRLYFDDTLGRNADEVLEIVFSQIHHDRIDGQDAEIETLLGQYTNAMFGLEAIPLGDTLSNPTQARRWCSQFGHVHEWKADEDELLKDPESASRGAQFFARVGESAPVSTPHVATAIVLAGVQHLRELAESVLNPIDGEKAN